MDVETQILQDLDRTGAALGQSARVTHEIDMVGGDDFKHHWHLYVTGNPEVGDSGDGPTLADAFLNLQENLRKSGRLEVGKG